MSEPVTIGGQTFIKDPDKGWIDKKTKKPADTALVKLLDTLDLKPVQPKLKPKINRAIEPVSIGNTKYVYDSNQQVWVTDDSMRWRPPDSMQKVLNAAHSQAANDTILGMGKQVEQAFGTLGGAAKAQVRTKTEPKARPAEKIKSPYQSAAVINPIIVQMITVLSSIDSTIKQQLDQKKQLDRQNAEQADENRLEATDQTKELVDTVEKEEKKHATRMKTGNLLLAGGAAYLLAKQFDPLMEAVTSIGNTVYDLAKTTFSVAETMNNWIGAINRFKFANLFGGAGSGDVPTQPAAPQDNPPPAPAPAAPPPASPVKQEEPGFFKRVFNKITEFVTGTPIDPNTGKLQTSDAQRQAPARKAPAAAAERFYPVDNWRMTSSQGTRNDPFGSGRRQHTGIDIGGAMNSPVKAAAAGKVSFAKYARAGSGYGGYGNAVIIQHNDGTQTLYGHLNAINVQEGDVVKAGQIIGKLGSTGRSTGPHLHFQANRAGARGHKEGLLDTAAWLKGATQSQTIDATREDTVDSRAATTTDTFIKAALVPITTRSTFSNMSPADIAAMNRVVTPESITKINRSQVEKTGDMVDAVQPYVPLPAPPPSLPNLNAPNPKLGIKTPPVPEDKRILVDYLNYMNVLPAQTTDVLTL